MDFAPYMISLAREDANRRNSNVESIEVNIFSQDFGKGRFDIITCYDSISDFPLCDCAKLVKKIACALKNGGQFVVKYNDGSHKYFQKDRAHEGVYQEEPERPTYRFKEYLPVAGAIANNIRNETRGEDYERKVYIYTAPIVCVTVGNTLELEEHITLDESQYIDIFNR
jgi:ubiquinone/menaquinone biosynthesis C-methylase UbiE